ncbi:MAG TPA: hypothetical protein VD997_02740 [Phycisphaerales bacterium]|nr:hypothetical protein [Phycisphaerales bacterium]
MKLLQAISAAAAAIAAAISQAHQLPALETGPAQVNCRLVEGQLEMRDAATGAYLIARQGFKMVRDSGPGVTHELTLQTQPTGADVLIKLTNTSQQPQRAGTISTGIYNLGHEIEYLDGRKAAKMVKINRDAPAMASFGAQYPDATYSPVMVIKNQNVAFGVSIQYPLMQYKHDVTVGIASPGSSFAEGPAGKGWLVWMNLCNLGGETVYTRQNHPCIIPPGETLTYVVSVRMTRDVQNWVTTLMPYRNYFRSLYGGVKYMRRTSPVLGMSASEGSNHSDTNIYAYRNDIRPDLRGWGPAVESFGRFDYKSRMIWGLSGWYRNNKHLNYPYLVASPLRNHPKLSTIFDPSIGLARLATDGREVGVWWGRALEICRQWDTNEAILFDPDNPELAAIQLREMQAIYDTGARVVGLDTFGHRRCPVWKSIPWLQDMQARFPGVSFVTEPWMSDVMNLVAASYLEGVAADYGRPASVADMYAIKGPHVLADFIVPGHEHWASLHYHLQRQYFGLEASPALIEADVRRFASWGYVPILFVDMDAPRNVNIARSWETSLPAAIVASDPYIQNLKNGRLPNYVAPAPQPQPQPQPPPTGGGSSGSGGSGGSSGGNGAITTQPRINQQLKPTTNRKVTGFLGIRPSTKPVSGGQPAPGGSGGAGGSSGGQQPAAGNGKQPRLAVTITQRFNRKVKGQPQMQADKTQGLIDAMNKQAREEQDQD